MSDSLRFECDTSFSSMPTVITDPTRRFMTTGDVVGVLNEQADDVRRLRATLGGGDTAIRQLEYAVEGLELENARLRAALELIAQVRHASGSAQGAFRANLQIADAALAGADLRDLSTVEAVSSGSWKPSPANAH